MTQVSAHGEVDQVVVDADGNPCAPSTSDDFAELVHSVRDVLDALCCSDAPADVQRDLAAQLRGAAAQLRRHTVLADEAPAGRRPDLPGQGHPLLPAITVTDLGEREVRAVVSFSPAHHGSGGAVHGGFLPLVYDDVLGRLAARCVVPLARTCSLRVDYKAVTWVGRPIRVEGKVEAINGRKIFVSGRMSEGDRLLTTAEALFLTLRPGQP